jgi:pyruvate/2-oxoglutarate dehydrogenase complex dihydrolipoamide dehydrogenase (E3) component
MSETQNRIRDLVIIGGGAGGLVVASVAAQLGLDVALIEKNPQPGGDCLHYGCVPSKALLKVAQVAETVRRSHDYGIKTSPPAIDIEQVNATVKRAIDTIQPHDSRERFESLGCEVVTGEAQFQDAHSIVANDQIIRAKKFVIATGSAPFVPPIEGLTEIDYLTNENMFSLPALPETLVILGAGPVGVEMAQSYARLGCKVKLVEAAERLLPTMDKDIATSLSEVLLQEGVEMYTGSSVRKVSKHEAKINVELANGQSMRGDSLLVATGRRAVVEGLGLERAGVRYTQRGVEVNARMQTSAKHIFACGDVTGQLALTHVAELQAGVVIANIVFKLPKRMSQQAIPLVVYTDPECAQIGLSENDAVNIDGCSTVRFEMAELDRAIAEHKTAGFAKLIVRKGRLLGVQIVGPHAGDVIHEFALAMHEKIKLSKITALVHAYPSYAQISKRAAGAYFSPALYSAKTKTVVKWLHRLLP